MDKNRIMAIGAHADDVEIGFGGMLAKYLDQGYEIVYVESTNNMSGGVSVLNDDGTRKKWHEPPVKMMPRRKKECDAAAAMLNTTPIHLDHPQRHYRDENDELIDLEYDSKWPEGIDKGIPNIMMAHEHKPSVEKLKNLILEKDPECLFSHGVRTTSPEHVMTALLVTKAYWKAVDEGFKGAYLHSMEDYSCFGPSNAKWDTYIDISDYVDRKMELIGAHACQMPTAHYPDHGHRLRVLKQGVTCGCKAAEVFVWVNRNNCPDKDGTTGGYSPLTVELTQNTK
ncbi:MAG: PIG-L deacetylase family protein [Planctomycetota bacterium]|jgi:LmbE family N-acetylglucosaminyl deacetylase